MKKIAVKDVDAYLAATAEPARSMLEKIRKIVKQTAPDAVEVICYQIPAYKYHGMLVGFAAFKEHCSLFVMSGSFLAGLKDELKGYETTKSAIHFPIGKPLPAALVKKIVKARLAENEARANGNGNASGKKRVAAKKLGV